MADRVARGLAAHGVRGPFGLVGHSLGAAVALTLAARRPRTVRRLVLVAPAGLASLPRVARRVLALAADPALAARRALVPLTDFAWGRRLLLAFAAADGASIPPLQARLMVGASASAQRTSDAVATITAADLRPLLREAQVPLGGVRGMIEDYLRYSRGWGFPVEELNRPVHLWHGVNDPLVPVEHALQLAAALPDCRVFFDADEGHHFFGRRLSEILAVLVGRAEAAGARGLQLAA